MTMSADGSPVTGAPATGTDPAAQQPAAPVAQQTPAAAPATPPAATPEGGAPAFKRPTVSDLPDETLSARLEHAKKVAAAKARADAFAELNITDPEAYKKKRADDEAKLKKFEDDEAKRQRAAMSEAQRVKADLDAANLRAEAAERELQAYRDAESNRTQSQRLESTAAKHIAPEFLDAAVSFKFKAYIKQLEKENPAALKDLDDRAIDKWFRDFAQKNPAYARREDADPTKQPEAPKPPERKVETVRRPVTTGVQPRAPGALPSRTPNGQDAASAAGKTVRPGLPNSMTPAEVREHARKQGYKWPA